jgi:hypothetical protein
MWSVKQSAVNSFVWTADGWALLEVVIRCRKMEVGVEVESEQAWKYWLAKLVGSSFLFSPRKSSEKDQFHFFGVGKPPHLQSLVSTPMGSSN